MSSLKLTLQSPEQIAYFLGHNNYSWLHFRHGERKLLAKPLSYLEAQLPEFIRVHKTVLVNPYYIRSLHQPRYKKMPGKVHMDTGEVFPVSRQRQTAVMERLHKLSTLAGDPQPVAGMEVLDQPATPLVVSQIPNLTTLSIVLVSSDPQKVQRVEHVLEQHWSAYQLKVLQPGVLLIDVLNSSPVSDYPALILVDAQTKTLDCLRLLRGLKASPQLRQIPIILLVSSGDPLIIEGYDEQANSVILMPDRYDLLEELVERILHYWVGVVALPRQYED